MRPISALAALSYIVSCAATISNRATTCNGYSELCNRSYGNVSFVGAHNSYAVGTNNLATNQDHDVTQQLKDGIRLLQVQAHNKSSVIELCHTSCSLFDGGTLADYLGKVKSWMSSNPNDVVTLLIVNIESLDVSTYDSVFKSAGMTDLVFVPTQASYTNTGWPTLGNMVDSGKRLVVFMDFHANFQTVPYIIDEFTNIWETAYDVTDTTFDCNVNRSSSSTSPSSMMYLINHFLDTPINSTLLSGSGILAPNTGALNTTNAVSGIGSLGLQVQQCTTQYSRPPNFMLVDFYEYGGGSVFQVAASLNGVSYSPNTPVATPLPTSSSSSSSSLNAGDRITTQGLSRVAVGSVLLGTFIGALTAV